MVVPGLKEAATLQEKATAILAAVADGEISAEAGDRLLRMLDTYGKAVVLDEHERRLQAMKAARRSIQPYPTRHAMSVSDIKRRLKAGNGKAADTDIRSAILAARHAEPTPRIPRQMRDLAAAPGAVGKIARGWLRIGFSAPTSTATRQSTPLPSCLSWLGISTTSRGIRPLRYDWSRERAAAW